MILHFESKDTDIGIYHLSDRKKPCLGIRQGINLTIYGTFSNEYMAKEFMQQLAKLVGVKSNAESNNS